MTATAILELVSYLFFVLPIDLPLEICTYGEIVPYQKYDFINGFVNYNVNPMSYDIVNTYF